MYVERLTREQVDKFIREHLIEADFHPELPSNKRQTEFTRHRHEAAIEIFYCSKLYNAHKSVYFMDDRMDPMIGKELEEDWIKYLYSIFGEEYKEWYMSKKEKLFR